MASASSSSMVTDKDGDGKVTKKEALDLNDDGRVSHKEFALLDANKNGGVGKQERLDINRDGHISQHEQNLLDKDGDGAVSRHEVLDAPVRDTDHNGKLTLSEALAGHHHPHHPPPLPVQLAAASPPPPLAPPPRTQWKHGLWETLNEGVGEMVLLVVCAAPLYQAIVWSLRRVRYGKAYRPIARERSEPMAPADLELANARNGGSAHIGGGDELEEISAVELSLDSRASEVCAGGGHDDASEQPAAGGSAAGGATPGIAYCFEDAAEFSASAPGRPLDPLEDDDDDQKL